MTASRRDTLRGAMALGALAAIPGCKGATPNLDLNPELRVPKMLFGTLDDGRAAELYTLSNASGMSVGVMTLGAAITSLTVPDRDGVQDDVVLGFDNPQSYLSEPGYIGVVLGRFANRIAGGRFELDGTVYELLVNNGPNHLHGGLIGFDKRIWNAEPVAGEGWSGVDLTLVSEDGDQGYPGTLTVRVEYRLDDENRLMVTYIATTDAPTVVNLSQHSYFNLEGHASGDVLGHELRINADRYTPIDDTGVPTGAIVAVEGTPLDFRTAKPIGRDIESDFEQIVRGSGFDHNLVLNGDPLPGSMVETAFVRAPVSGRTMRVLTDKPGVQFYSANFLKGQRGKGGVTYERREGLCLETQLFPDSPNKPDFPSARLNPGETYRYSTAFEFGIDKGPR